MLLGRGRASAVPTAVGIVVFALHDLPTRVGHRADGAEVAGVVVAALVIGSIHKAPDGGAAGEDASVIPHICLHLI